MAAINFCNAEGHDSSTAFVLAWKNLLTIFGSLISSSLECLAIGQTSDLHLAYLMDQ